MTTLLSNGRQRTFILYDSLCDFAARVGSKTTAKKDKLSHRKGETEGSRVGSAKGEHFEGGRRS